MALVSVSVSPLSLCEMKLQPYGPSGHGRRGADQLHSSRGPARAQGGLHPGHDHAGAFFQGPS